MIDLMDESQWRVVELDATRTEPDGYSADFVKIQQIDNIAEMKSLRAFVKLGENNSCKFWVTIQSGDTYTGEYTDADVDAAIQAFFAEAE